MLRSRDRRSDWEIRVLGPQQPDEYYFRCIIGRGERTGRSLSRPWLTSADCSMPVSSRSSMRSKSQPAGSSKPPASQMAAMVG